MAIHENKRRHRESKKDKLENQNFTRQQLTGQDHHQNLSNTGAIFVIGFTSIYYWQKNWILYVKQFILQQIELTRLLGNDLY